MGAVLLDALASIPGVEIRPVEPNTSLPPPGKRLKIVTDLSVLTRPSAPVTEAEFPDMRQLAAMMLETLYASETGVGLSAVQVGIHFRMCVIDVFALQPDKRRPHIMINPVALPISKVIPMREGCLSVPGKFGDVKRATTIRASWFDLDGVEHQEELGGLLAHVVQHEIDHMDGVLCTTKMEPGR